MLFPHIIEIYSEYVSSRRFTRFNCWTQNVSCFTGSSIISVCFQITPAFVEYWSGIGFQTMCDITNRAHKHGLYHQILMSLEYWTFWLVMNVRTASFCQTPHIYHSQTFNNRNKRKKPTGSWIFFEFLKFYSYVVALKPLKKFTRWSLWNPIQGRKKSGESDPNVGVNVQRAEGISSGKTVDLCSYTSRSLEGYAERISTHFLINSYWLMSQRPSNEKSYHLQSSHKLYNTLWAIKRAIHDDVRAVGQGLHLSKSNDRPLEIKCLIKHCKPQLAAWRSCRTAFDCTLTN